MFLAGSYPDTDRDAVDRTEATLVHLRERRLPEIRVEGPAAESKVIWMLQCFMQVSLYRTVMLAEGCASNWNSKSVLSCMLCGRSLMETAALFRRFLKDIELYTEKRDFPAIHQVALENSFATRLKEWSQDGAGVVAKNAVTMIDHLDKEIAGTRAHYDRMSEFCHPNYLGQYFLFGKRDKETSTVHLGLREEDRDGLFSHIFSAFFLIELFASTLDSIEALFPRILELSNAEKTKRTLDNGLNENSR